VFYNIDIFVADKEKNGLHCIFRPTDRITVDKGSITSIWSSRWQIASFMTRVGCIQIILYTRVSTLKCVVLYVAMSRLIDGIDFSVVATVAPRR
jgi:hypothetical protein